MRRGIRGVNSRFPQFRERFPRLFTPLFTGHEVDVPLPAAFLGGDRTALDPHAQGRAIQAKASGRLGERNRELFRVFREQRRYVPWTVHGLYRGVFTPVFSGHAPTVADRSRSEGCAYDDRSYSSRHTT
jgi:hypothetical protein